MPLQGAPQRTLDPGASGLPIATIYEVTNEIELVPTSQVVAGPSQAAGTSRQHEFAKNPERGKSLVSERSRSPPIWSKNTRPTSRGGRVQSLVAERALTPERARIPERVKTPE